jgi:antitoxin (DNA-binding transcriptional repressor) of toxin-antitoxin stability system
MPIQYKTMTELREKTASVLRATQRADVVITVRGKPQVMLQRITSDEVEGLQLLESGGTGQRYRKFHWTTGFRSPLHSGLSRRRDGVE